MITEKTPTTYTPADVIERTGLSIHTLRYYEKIGLLPEVARADNGHRRYSDTDIRYLKFITRMRRTGMPIRDIQDYLALLHTERNTHTERADILARHRDRLMQQLDDLNDTLEFVNYKIGLYQDKRDCLTDVDANLDPESTT
jgi:DNA-binding transcriptional MerR regulator